MPKTERLLIALLFLATCAKPTGEPAPAGTAPAEGTAPAASTAPAPSTASTAPVAPLDATVPDPPVLRVVGEGGDFAPLGVTRAELDVEVVGAVCRTRTTLTFANPHGRALEGELVFPLPAEVTVSGYALDVGGQMVDAVVVEKEKARVVFEQEVRKGVDPGLVEAVGGNAFRTRVYPVPAGGTRTVAIETIQALQLVESDGVLRLPLSFDAALVHFGLSVREPQTRTAPRLEWSGIEPPALSGDSQELHADIDASGRGLRGAVTVHVARPGTVVATETSADGEVHFLAADPLRDLPRTAGAARGVRRVAIYWDASRSRARADHARVLDAFASYFGALADAGSRSVQAELVVFAHQILERKVLTIDGGDVAPLRAAVAGIAYDGGTQMAAIDAKAAVPDVSFLVSDGMSNVGRPDPEGLPGPWICISAETTVNHVFLQHLARRSGGMVVDLQVRPPEALREAIADAPLAVVSVEASEGRVAQVLPAVGTPIDGMLALSGKLLTADATVRVGIGRAGKVLHTVTFALHTAEAPVGQTLAKLWAQRRAAELGAFPKRNAQGLVALGQRYGLVTPGTSMLVLERLEQYVEHHVRPPASLPEMRAAYDAEDAQQESRAAEDRAQKLERIVQLWNERVAWWETKFDYRKVEAEAKAEKKEARSRNGHDHGAPSAAPPPAPSAPPRAEAQGMAPAMDDMLEGGASPEAEEVAAAKPAPVSAGPEASIELQPWTPDTPYLKELDAAPPAASYARYLELANEYGGSPAFFLDCADFFFRHEQRAIGLRVLTNVAELEIEDAPLLRVLAHRLAQLDELELSRLAFEQVLAWRPEEPQSYRDLALVLAREKSYARAMELLARVVLDTWDRFAEIELIALMELNHIIPQARAAGITDIPIDARLIKLLDVDIRISLSWDADLTDIDMWVVEPTGDKAYYANNHTPIGGLVSRDFTQGYGPEEYVIHHAMPGTYTVQANYFGSRAQTLTGAVTVQLDLYSNYGRPNEKHQAITLRLSEARETITVGTLKL